MKRFTLSRLCAIAFAACLVVTLSAGSSAAADEQTAAEKLRAALDRPHEAEIARRPLPEAIRLLSEQTGLTFVLDPSVTADIEPRNAPAAIPAITPGFVGPLAPGMDGRLSVPGQEPTLEMYAADAPLRVSLRQALEPLGLGAVVVGDRVVIARPAIALDRQMNQSVTVDIDRRELGDTLRNLGRQSGVNVVLDPKAAKEALTPLTLRLDETPLESAVAILADAAGLRSVRLGNVLYVTSDSRAAMLRAERDAHAFNAALQVLDTRTAKPRTAP